MDNSEKEQYETLSAGVKVLEDRKKYLEVELGEIRATLIVNYGKNTMHKIFDETTDTTTMFMLYEVLKHLSAQPKDTDHCTCKEPKQTYPGQDCCCRCGKLIKDISESLSMRIEEDLNDTIAERDKLKTEIVELREHDKKMTANSNWTMEKTAKLKQRNEELEKALRKCIATLSDKAIGTTDYMEGSDIYSDFREAVDCAEQALSKGRE